MNNATVTVPTPVASTAVKMATLPETAAPQEKMTVEAEILTVVVIPQESNATTAVKMVTSQDPAPSHSKTVVAVEMAVETWVEAADLMTVNATIVKELVTSLETAPNLEKNWVEAVTDLPVDLGLEIPGPETVAVVTGEDVGPALGPDPEVLAPGPGQEVKILGRAMTEEEISPVGVEKAPVIPDPEVGRGPSAMVSDLTKDLTKEVSLEVGEANQPQAEVQGRIKC